MSFTEEDKKFVALFMKKLSINDKLKSEMDLLQVAMRKSTKRQRCSDNNEFSKRFKIN